MPPRSADDDLLAAIDNDDDELLTENVPVRKANAHASATRWRHEESSAFHKAAGSGGSGSGSAGGGGGGSWKHKHPLARDPEPRGRVNELADFLNTSRISPEEVQRDNAAASSSSAAQTASASDSKHGKMKVPKSKTVMAGGAEARHGDAMTAEGKPEAEVNSGDGGAATLDDTVAEKKSVDVREIACGPLLNYRRTEGTTWVGSVLVVTRGGGKTQEYVPTLKLGRAGPRTDKGAVSNGVANAEKSNGEQVNGTSDTVVNGEGSNSKEQTITAICLYSDPRNTFWRFDISVELEATETEWAYTLPELKFHSKTKPQRSTFFVPAITESMRIMFHSCNGFSVGTDEAAWSGPALWNDVMRRHREAPFHVMIGGGDQIYNDGIRVSGPLRQWTDIGNPKKRREYPFPEKLRQDCDNYYLKNYIRWYSIEPFAQANGQIAQLNIWDDHDIIDGFGSYVNEFMKCDVFRGIGGTAHKYYMLFQHHLPPPLSTYTSDAPPAADAQIGQGLDPKQLVDTFVHEAIVESNYIIGSRPGPYVAERSHSMFARLGARIAFIGIDARTERTRHQVNYPETYDQIFARLRQELGDAAALNNPYRHLILLLGIPIAYPRLTWLENIFSSPVMGPIKFMNRRFGLGGGFFNYFDGSVDLLDDLDDHYTARTHKKERNRLIERLQGICAEYSVRLTILGGDVHLCALGRFYSNPSLNIPTENDFRYMANVVSSAIVNKPPPQAIANLLARRNKIHHLNPDTDETLMDMFDKDPGESTKTANFNHVTMPSRNFAMITENSPNNPPPPPPSSSEGPASPDAAPSEPLPGQQDQLTPPTAVPPTNGTSRPNSSWSRRSGRSAKVSHKSSRSKLTSHRKPGAPTRNAGHLPLHAGEVDAGTRHKAASVAHGKGNDGSLDVCLRVEKDQHDAEGHTEKYGFTIPHLVYTGPVPELPPVAEVRTSSEDGEGRVEDTA